MKLTDGITIGKFMPLHKGHELMIEFGAAALNRLTILVSGKETDEIPLSIRYKWMNDFIRRNDLHNVSAIMHDDESPEPSNIDEKGTVLDPEFQAYWKNEFEIYGPSATHFVSSDQYGQVMANLLNLEWLPVDPKRDTVSISGTEIRKDIVGNFKYISDVAKPYFIKTVAIVGPESTGKSTMAKTLSEIFETIGVHEYGRTLSEVKNNELSELDFYSISLGQDALIEIAKKKSDSPVIFTDTEAFTTFLFGKIYLGVELDTIKQKAISQKIDLYIVLAPTVKWIDDGTRVVSDQIQRQQFFAETVNFLTEHKKPFVVINDKFYSDRTSVAIYEVEKLLKGKSK